MPQLTHKPGESAAKKPTAQGPMNPQAKDPRQKLRGLSYAEGVQKLSPRSGPPPAVKPAALPEVPEKVTDTIDLLQKVVETKAYRGYNLLTGAVSNKSGNLRGMVNNSALAKTGDVLGKVGMALNVPEALNEAARYLPQMDALSRRTDLSVLESTWEFTKIITVNGTNAGVALLGLSDSKRDVGATLQKVDQLSRRTDLNTLQATVEFAKFIVKGGTKTFLDALPFGGIVADKITL